MIMGSFDHIATETVRDHETVKPVHEVLRVLGERARAGSLPGERRDGFRVALAIEGGGMRGTISAGMALALDELGLVSAFDAVYGASAGTIPAPGCSAGHRGCSAGPNPPTPAPSSSAPRCCAAGRRRTSGH
jgi:hypothetical protein